MPWGNSRFGLTAKTVIVTSMIALISIGATLMTSRALQRLQRNLDRISTTALEQLMTSVRLVQQTESLVSLGLILTQSNRQDERRQTLVELNDRIAWMRKVSQDLAADAGDLDLIERVNARESALADNLKVLDSLVKDRIDGVRTPQSDATIGRLSERHRELAAELSVMMGYFAATRRSQLADQSAALSLEVQSHQRNLLMLTAVLLASVVLSGMYFEWRLARRLVKLQRAVADPMVKPQDLVLDGNDELAQLSQTVAHYVGRIQAHESDMKAANDELAFLAEHDSLTKLANRRHFETAACRLLQTSGFSLCVVICDVDHFKRVNDLYGHSVGDEALVHLARVLQSCMRSNDILARFGGEEFSIVLTVRNAAEAREVLERIRLKVFKQPVRINNAVIPITLSFGALLMEPVHETVASHKLLPAKLLAHALRHADDALYQAKSEGRDCIVFSAAQLTAATISEPMELTPIAGIP